MKKSYMGKGHTGKIHHGGMPKAVKHDALAHESHGKMNQEHGTPGSFAADSYQGVSDEHGGEGMASNCEYD